VWFADPFGDAVASGPQILPYLDYAAVLRMARNERGAWVIRRMTEDTSNPRCVLLSADEQTVYVSEGNRRPQQARELRAYPVRDEETLGQPIVLHSFGTDFRGVHRGIEGMCLDADDNIVAVGGWRRSGPRTAGLRLRADRRGDRKPRRAFGPAHEVRLRRCWSRHALRHDR
jgi:gluconolactonase